METDFVPCEVRTLPNFGLLSGLKRTYTVVGDFRHNENINCFLVLSGKEEEFLTALMYVYIKRRVYLNIFNIARCVRHSSQNIELQTKGFSVRHIAQMLQIFRCDVGKQNSLE
jgi:hypothetical protein